MKWRFIQKRVIIFIKKDEINEVEKNFGTFDYSTASVIAEDNQKLSSVLFVTKSSTIQRLIILESSDKEKIVKQLFVSQLSDNDGQEIKSVENIKNGVVKLFSLNSGIVHQKAFSSGEEKYSELENGLKVKDYEINVLDEKGNIIRTATESERMSWGGKYKTCINNQISKWGVFEWGSCIIASEVCLPGLLGGCAVYATFF